MTFNLWVSLWKLHSLHIQGQFTPKPKESRMRMSIGFEGLGDLASRYWVSIIKQGFPGGSAVKSMPIMQETQETRVWSLDWGDPLEKEMANHSSILAGKIPWTEEPGRLRAMGSQSRRWLKWLSTPNHLPSCLRSLCLQVHQATLMPSRDPGT